MSEDKGKRRSFFTPCRTVGLKRKSIGTPSPAQNSPKTTPEVVQSEPSNVTPKRVKENVEGIRQLSKKLKTLSREDENETLVSEEQPFRNDTKLEESSSFNLEEEICETESRLGKLKDEIRDLESVSLNAKQHDRSELDKLTLKWRCGCQEALNDLLIEYRNRDNGFTMSSLLSTLGIPPSLVHYSETETDFYD